MTARDLQTRSITAQDQFTDPVYVNGEHLDIHADPAEGGSFTANVVLQKAFTAAGTPPEAGDWLTVATFTGQTHKILDMAGTGWWRLGVKTGGFTSGPILLRLQKGRALV